MHLHPRYINAQNNNLQELISNFVPILCHFCGFGLFFSTSLLICCLLLMQLLRDYGDADDARAPGPPSPTTDQIAYIPNSINEETCHVTTLVIRICVAFDHIWCFGYSRAAATEGLGEAIRNWPREVVELFENDLVGRKHYKICLLKIFDHLDHLLSGQPTAAVAGGEEGGHVSTSSVPVPMRIQI